MRVASVRQEPAFNIERNSDRESRSRLRSLKEPLGNFPKSVAVTKNILLLPLSASI
ncbi:MAG: hypothetical protein WBC71_06270 [Salaquimonas sp.]